MSTDSLVNAGPTRTSSRGEALDPSLYHDPEVLEAELGSIFARSWQYAGHVGELAEAGDYLTARAGDQPVLVLRGYDGELRAYRNVCRHRGSELLSGSGHCKKAIRCRYHGWTYDSGDGRLLGVPEHRGYERLEKAELGLLPARVGLLEGLIFINLDLEAPPLAEVTAGLAERLRPYRIDELVSFASSRDGTRQPANWKVVVENYLEGYHVPIAHPGLMRLFDYQRYTVETHGGWAWFDAPLREAPSANRLERLYQRLARPMPGLSESDAKVWRYVLIYPNTTIDLYPDQVNVWQIRPAGVDVTTDSWACLRPRRSGPITRLVQRANNKLNTLVLDEDVDLVRGVQEGTRTRGYQPGPLSAREAGVAWFADRIRADLAAADER
jgi:choline monooxygenase